MSVHTWSTQANLLGQYGAELRNRINSASPFVLLEFSTVVSRLPFWETYQDTFTGVLCCAATMAFFLLAGLGITQKMVCRTLHSFRVVFMLFPLPLSLDIDFKLRPLGSEYAVRFLTACSRASSSLLRPRSWSSYFPNEYLYILVGLTSCLW